MPLDRLDKVLVSLGLAPTRTKAQDLIAKKRVLVGGKIAERTSIKVNPEDVELLSGDDYVGRGAYKIEGALKSFNVDPADMIVADVGASTGGFTDFVLRRGAKKVYAIDVGRDQLAHELRQDSRVINMEGINIRNPLELDEKVNLAVADLSYISLRLTLETIFSLVDNSGKIVALVKPQFEVGREHVGKNGIVKDGPARINMLRDLYHWCGERGFFIADAIISPIKGKTGNIEYFFLFDKKLRQHLLNVEALENL